MSGEDDVKHDRSAPVPLTTTASIAPPPCVEKREWIEATEHLGVCAHRLV